MVTKQNDHTKPIEGDSTIPNALLGDRLSNSSLSPSDSTSAHLSEPGQVLIVSIFGRGHWLAAKLQKEKIPVQLIDISHLMGPWPPEDIAGPFGFFKSEYLDDLEVETVFSEDPYESNPSGFTLLLEDGPLELHGPLTSFRLQTLGIPAFVERSLHLSPKQLQSMAGGLQKEFSGLSFEKAWLGHLAFALAASRSDSDDPVCGNFLNSNLEPVPLFSTHYTRLASRNSLDRSLEWLKNQGVQVLKGSRPVDFSMASNKCLVNGIEFEGEGITSLSKLIWCLSHEETFFLAPKIAPLIYASKNQESEWSWVRYRVQLSKSLECDLLPPHFCMIGELGAQWTHSNLISILRTGAPEQFDVWLKLPTLQRFNKEYLNMEGAKVTDQLTKKLGGVACQVVSYPQEYYYTYSQIGAPRFPVYPGIHQPSDVRAPVKDGIYFHSPEVWKNLAYSGQFSHLNRIYLELIQWWLKRQSKALKDQTQ